MSLKAPSDDEDEEEGILDSFPSPRENTRETTGNEKRHSDAASIRRFFGVGAYDRDKWDYNNLWPNVLDYQWNAGPDHIDGGTDLLGVGKPGSGKSTLLNHLALRAIEVPRSKVVWRAATNRSEWLPLAPWVTLCLPAGVDLSFQFAPRRATGERVDLDERDLDEFVREVEYYDGVRDLNERVLDRGKIHVVYPDPLMRGCQAAYESSEEKAYDTPNDRRLFEPEDPSKHFWFGWILDRVERGPHFWTTLILDEIGDIAEDGARKDQYGTYQKVKLLRDCWVDARKKGLSIYSFGHSETDIHQLIRHKVRWRVTMNGTANPTAASSVVGFESVPMMYDLTSRLDIGQALIWNEQNFEKFAWPDYSAPVDHKLEVQMGGSA